MIEFLGGRYGEKKCFLCDSNLKTQLKTIPDVRFGIKGSWAIGKCSNCGIVQTTSVPPSDQLRYFYENYYNFHRNKGTNYIKFRRQFLFSRFYRMWLAIDGDISFHSVNGSGRLLDAGCNEGRGMILFKKNGFEVEGLEPNPRAAVEARKKGFKIFTKSIEEHHPKEPVDVVVLSNVLEHSFNPKLMLSRVYGFLKIGGHVWISCPNFNSWQRILFKKYWINWHVPFHLSHFSKETLFNLLKETGFQIVKEKQKSPSLWMAQSIIARLFARTGDPTVQMRKAFLVGPLMVVIRFLLFPLLWIGNLLARGDCLVVMAKKI